MSVFPTIEIEFFRCYPGPFLHRRLFVGFRVPKWEREAWGRKGGKRKWTQSEAESNFLIATAKN